MADGQGTKLVKVEGKVVRVPSDATPDEIDQIAGGHPATPPAMAPGSFQTKPGGPITTPTGTMPSNPSAIVDDFLKSGQYGALAAYKEELPGRKEYEQSSMRWGGAGMNPKTALKALGGTALGAPVGAAIGRYAGGPKYGDIGAGFGGLIGGLYGGYRAAAEKPLMPGSMSKIPGMLGRIGNVLETMRDEPAENVPGTAREMAGGTAATTTPSGEGVTDTALGSQAGPGAPQNARELSATVQRTRAGTAQGTAANPTSPLSLEGIAQQQGMASAAGGKAASEAMQMTPESRRILQILQQKGIVP